MVFRNLFCSLLLCINLLAVLLLIERLKTSKLGKRALIVTKDKKVYDLMNDNLHALESRDKSSAMLYLKEIKDLCKKRYKDVSVWQGISHVGTHEWRRGKKLLGNYTLE